NGTVDAADELIARNNYTTVLNALRYLNLSNPPAAPQASPAVASANGEVSRTEQDQHTQTALLADEPQVGAAADTSSLPRVLPMALASRARGWPGAGGKHFDGNSLDDALIELLASSRFGIRV
ncbi:MAG TPA: hypothetical protein VL175_13010, partial [Pirellulales bacterium]|nr:hypothetical protein [Pirellulales bacterium]